MKTHDQLQNIEKDAALRLQTVLDCGRELGIGDVVVAFVAACDPGGGASKPEIVAFTTGLLAVPWDSQVIAGNDPEKVTALKPIWEIGARLGATYKITRTGTDTSTPVGGKAN